VPARRRNRERSALLADVMSSETTLTEDDEGKRVVDAVGDDVGRLVDVRETTAYVDPGRSAAERIVSKLGWGPSDGREPFRVHLDDVEAVADGEVYLHP
jgi:hypothetical protein